MGRKERAKRRKSPGGNFTLGGVAHEGGRRLPLRATDGCDGEGSSHFCQNYLNIYEILIDLLYTLGEVHIGPISYGPADMDRALLYRRGPVFIIKSNGHGK